jgi:hypothetical protein
MWNKRFGDSGDKGPRSLEKGLRKLAASSRQFYGPDFNLFRQLGGPLVKHCSASPGIREAQQPETTIRIR